MSGFVVAGIVLQYCHTMRGLANLRCLLKNCVPLAAGDVNGYKNICSSIFSVVWEHLLHPDWMYSLFQVNTCCPDIAFFS